MSGANGSIAKPEHMMPRQNGLSVYRRRRVTVARCPGAAG